MGAVALVLIIGFNFIIAQFKSKTTNGTASASINPTSIYPNISAQPVVTSGNKIPLYVTSTYPVTKSNNIPVSSSIVLTFIRSPQPNEFEFSINPPAPFNQLIDQTKVTIKPRSPLLPGTTYTFTVKMLNQAQLPQSYWFTTAGPTTPYLPNTKPSGAANEENNFQLQNHPDVYLSNNTPFTTVDFSITSAYQAQPTGHFAFTVMLKGSDLNTAKIKANNWMRSLGLSDSQIQTLDITYTH